MKYTLVDLEYPEDALEPYIDAETVSIHHGKHQALYVEKLNAALALVPEFKFHGTLCDMLSNLDVVPESIRNDVRKNGGGALNHAFYWAGLSPRKTEMNSMLARALEHDFGSLAGFYETITKNALETFGSGWAWLVCNSRGVLSCISTQNQDSPVMGDFASLPDDLTPLFCIDVWEHAYYLKYRNKRAEYVRNIQNIIDWARVSQRYAAALDNSY